MVKFLPHVGRRTGRYLGLLVLTSTLAACGGSGGDSEPDFDGDGEPDITDLDADGDGIDDINDPFIDLDGDGFDDVIGAQDLDNDGILNRDDDDADGDGLLDAGLDDKFVDLDQDGFDDVSGLREGPANFPEVTDTDPCGGEPGSVAYGQEPSWNDNCLIRRTTQEGDGQFADSLYAVGVQRIVFCSGFGTATDDDYRAFADGEYGPLSEAAMQQFQASEPNPISDDGQVGAQSWAKLQGAMERLERGEQDAVTGDVSPDVYGFTEGRCAGIPMLYQSVSFDSASQSFVVGGWRLARNTPNQALTVPFSIDKPFGRLD